MELIHCFGQTKVERTSEENAGFLLTSKNGSYCSFFSSQNSRYNGLFFFDEKDMEMYKFIESIDVLGGGGVLTLQNNFFSVERLREDATETFIMPRGRNSLIYELSKEHNIDLFLDCKKSKDNREFGRYYEISEEDGCVIVKFTKKTSKNEDASEGIEEYSLYLAIKGDKYGYTQKNGEWAPHTYPLDELRNSRPFSRYVYNSLRLSGSRFVFSMSRGKKDALEECKEIFFNLNLLKTKEKEYFADFCSNEQIKKLLKNKNIGSEIKASYLCALNSLNCLVVKGKNYGIFAGLPWFYQFWSRDSLICTLALSKIDHDTTNCILIDYIRQIRDDGRLPNIHGVGSANADAHGWLFFRMKEVIHKINKSKKFMASMRKSIRNMEIGKNLEKDKLVKKSNLIVAKKEDDCHGLLYEIESALEKSLYGLAKFHTKDGLEENASKETWMDTEAGNERSEYCIEIQAFRLNMYRLQFELTQDHKYLALENVLKNKVVKGFWNGSILADGLNDFRVRPNVFIAAYAYPWLLSQEEWEICFERVLGALWLDWGGLSTIGKNDPLFTDKCTGEDPKSYHRGDSWFWINNLSALVLNRVNKEKFKDKIEKIITASTQEILWKGCIGCHSEVSSAKELGSEGCFNQAWSNAMFVEMIDEIFK